MGSAIGWVLIVAGGLWLLLTGGCTLFSFWMLLGMAAGPTNANLSGLFTFVVIAVIAMAPGALLVWGGLRLARGPRP